MEQHIGLGHNAHIVSIKVYWPATGSRQEFTAIKKNQLLAIREFAPDYKVLEQKTFRFKEDTSSVAR